MQKRLTDLIEASGMVEGRGRCEIIAQELLCEGVIVPPCKVGQTVYAVSNYYGGEWQIYECRVDNFTVYEKNTFMSISNPEGYNFGANISEIGKTVFLTKEQAKKELAKIEGRNNG